LNNVLTQVKVFVATGVDIRTHVWGAVFWHKRSDSIFSASAMKRIFVLLIVLTENQSEKVKNNF